MQTPFFTIRIDERDIAGLAAEISYEDCLEMDDQLRISIKGLPTDEWENGLFLAGKELDFQFGYRGGLVSPMRSMRISDVEVSYGKTVDITIKAHDFGQLLKKQPSNKVWVNKTMAEIALEIATKYGLDTSRIEQTTLRHQHIPQGTRTDWELLHYLIDIESDGSWHFYVKGRALVLERVALDKTPSHTYTYGSNIVSFKPALKDSQQKTDAKSNTLLDPLTGQTTKINVDASNAKDEHLLGGYSNATSSKQGGETSIPKYDSNGNLIK
jgi:phage protein D